MKILFFSTYFYPYISGITISPLKILTFLTKKNKVTILTFPHQSNLAREEKFHGLNIVRLPYWFKVSKGFISPQSLFYFFNEIKKTEIVFLNIPNFEGLALAIMAKIFNKKTVSIFHCLVYPQPTIISQIVIFFLNLSIYFQLLFSNVIVGYTKDYIDQTWVGKWFKKKIRYVLPPVYPAKPWRSGVEKHHKNKIVIGFAGRISQEKGLEYLIEACKIVGAYYDTPVQLHFAGPSGEEVAGENTYYLKIKKLLDQSKLKYKFYGSLKNSELIRFYQSIDILVLPSINSTEAFGMVQAEAMLQGTPVIATNLPGVRMPIKLTKMGIIVPIKNSQKITDAIIEIINHRSKYTNKELVEKAREIFNVNITYKFYDDLFSLIK